MVGGARAAAADVLANSRRPRSLGQRNMQMQGGLLMPPDTSLDMP